MKRVLLLVSVVVVVVAALAGLVYVRRQQNAAPVANSGALTIPQSASADAALSGMIRPQHVVAVGATTAGLIEYFLAEPGDEVTVDQPLAHISGTSSESAKETAATIVERIRDRVARAEEAYNAARMEESRANADLQRAQTAVEKTRSAYERQSMLFERKATARQTFTKAQSEYQDAQNQFELAQKVSRSGTEYVANSMKTLEATRSELDAKLKELDEAQAKLDESQVRSPVDGIVIQRNGQPGTPAQEIGDQMFLIATDVFALEVPLEPQPPALAKIHPGMQTMVVVPGGWDLPIGGTVKSVEHGNVVVTFDSPSATIKSGMKAEVRFKFD